MQNLRYLDDVSTLTLDADKCVGCKACLEVCPHQVFGFADKKAVIADKDACMECGACALNCPGDALAVNPGVGCAAAILHSWITGEEPNCDCGPGGADCC